MEFISENREILQQYKQGFAIRQEKKEKEEKASSTDITTKQSFWDMAVIS